MTPPPRTETPTASTGDVELVAEICRRVIADEGDVPTLAAREAERLAPLHSPAARDTVVRRVVAHLTGLGTLDALLEDPTVDEVIVNSGREVWVERAGRLTRQGSLETEQVEHLVERVIAPLGRRIDRSSPIVDARLPDGARVCAVLPPIAVDGAALAIRRLARRPRDLTEFTDAAGAALVRTIIDRRLNVVVCGSTSSGKTSFVGALVDRCADDERLVIVEDTTELPVRGGNVLRLETRPASPDGPPPIDLDHLVRTALRLRPDRIIVGEIRGDEVVALVNALNTGHDGSLSTVHANGPLDALLRLESLVLRAAPSWPLPAIRQLLCRSIDVIVHVAQGDDGRRGVLAIDELDADAGEELALHPLARTDGTGGVHVVSEPRRRR